MATSLSENVLTIETILLKRGTENALKDITLKAGEKAVVVGSGEANAGRTKTGIDGVTKFSALPWDDEIIARIAPLASSNGGNLAATPVDNNIDETKTPVSAKQVKDVVTAVETVKFDKENVENDDTSTVGSESYVIGTTTGNTGNKSLSLEAIDTTNDANKVASLQVVKQFAADVDEVKFDKKNVDSANFATIDINGKLTAVAENAANNADDEKTASLSAVKNAVRGLKNAIDSIDTHVAADAIAAGFKGTVASTSNIVDENGSALKDDGTAINNETDSATVEKVYKRTAASLQDLIEVATRLLALESITTVDGGVVTANSNP